MLAEEPGTIGVAVNQLYSEQQPTKRGALMVRRVASASAAAAAGIQPGDLILATDGKSVSNTEVSEVLKRFAGLAETPIQLSVVRADGKLKTITLIRQPYPPHLNAPEDTFRYSIPGDWQKDPRYPFPLPWSPTLWLKRAQADERGTRRTNKSVGMAAPGEPVVRELLKGFEDLYFAPGFDDLDSPEYHSYLFLWWLDGKQQITVADLQMDMVLYFRGLAEQRGRNNDFKPDLSQVSAQYAKSLTGPSSLGGTPAASFSGTVTLYDRHGKVISLHSEVTSSHSPDGHTAVFFVMSKQPRPSPLWLQFDAAKESFRYQR